jgi:1-acyl-sn-glycerol-3-phosphate acyltransferase
MIATALATIVRLGAGVTVRWIGGRPQQGQRIYFANHSSHLDTLLLWGSLPAEERRRTRPVAAADYWEAGRLRRALAGCFNPVLIDRHRIPGRPDPVEVMLSALAEPSSLIIFPEGTRAAHGEVGRFRAGLYRLARLRPDLQLVPAYLANVERALPKGAWLPAPLPCSVSFGPALPPADGESCGAFLTRARAAVLDLKECTS